MEITFHAKIATVESTDYIQGYCTNPKEDIIRYTKSIPEIITVITSVIESITETLRHVKLKLDEIYYESSEKMRPKTKSSKLVGILKNIETTTSQIGNQFSCMHVLKRYSEPQYF